MQHLEDLKDMLEVDVAVQTETNFRYYHDIRVNLIKEGSFAGSKIYIVRAAHRAESELVLPSSEFGQR